MIVDEGDWSRFFGRNIDSRSVVAIAEHDICSLSLEIAYVRSSLWVFGMPHIRNVFKCFSLWSCVTLELSSF